MYSLRHIKALDRIAAVATALVVFVSSLAAGGTLTMWAHPFGQAPQAGEPHVNGRPASLMLPSPLYVGDPPSIKSACLLARLVAETCRPGNNEVSSPMRNLSEGSVASSIMESEDPTWEIISQNLSPENRIGAIMADDPADGYAVLFDGRNSTGELNDTWIFKDGNWSQIFPKTPLPEINPNQGIPAMTWDPSMQAVLCFGGDWNNSSIGVDETWSFSNGTWTEIDPAHSPQGLLGGELAYDTADGYVVLFGSVNTSTGQRENHTWVFEDGDWTLLNGIMPDPPLDAVMTYDAADGYILLFGGLNATYYPVNDTWKFHAGNWTKLSTTNAPSARIPGYMVCDAATGLVTLFGGSDIDSFPTLSVNDTWSYSDGSWTQLHPLHSPPFAGYAFVYDSTSRVFLLVGTDSALESGYTWGWDAPTITLDLSQSSVDLGQEFTATANGSSPAGSLAYNWSSSTTFLGCRNSLGPFIACTPDATGIGLLNVSATDADGARFSLSEPFTIYTDPSVESIRASSIMADVGQSIIFNVTVTGGTGTYLGYNWTGIPSTSCSTFNA